MLRIIHITWLFPRYSETFITNPLVELEHHGYEQYILAVKDPRQRESLAREDRVPEVEVHTRLRSSQLLTRVFYSPNPVFLRNLVFSLPPHAGPQVVLIHWCDLLPYLLNNWEPFRCPVVVSCHEPDFSKSLVLFSSQQVAILRQVACIIVETRYQYEKLIALGYPENRLMHWQAGTDLEQIDDLSSRVQRPTRAPRLISAGRFVEKKGFLQAVDAVSLLHNRGFQLSYELLGDGHLLGELEHRIRAHGLEQVVSLPGKKVHPDLFEHLLQGDLFLAPSSATFTGDREGIMAAVLEAMACGLPVLSTRHGGTPEIIQHGVNGWLVPDNVPTGLAAAIEILFADPCRLVDLGKAARAFVHQHFNLKRQFTILRNLLERVGGLL